jgi:hypothetical protein
MVAPKKPDEPQISVYSFYSSTLQMQSLPGLASATQAALLWLYQGPI